MKKIEKVSSGHHTSKNMKDQIINNIKNQLNTKEKLILLISKKYTFKVFKLGCQYYFNWENATTTQIQENCDATQYLQKDKYRTSHIERKESLNCQI